MCEKIHAEARHFITQISDEYLCFPIVAEVLQDSFLLMENCHVLWKFDQACELESGWHLQNRKFSFSPKEFWYAMKNMFVGCDMSLQAQGNHF